MSPRAAGLPSDLPSDLPAARQLAPYRTICVTNV
jgi:hypothetical protein